MRLGERSRRGRFSSSVRDPHAPPKIGNRVSTLTVTLSKRRTDKKTPPLAAKAKRRGRNREEAACGGEAGGTPPTGYQNTPSTNR